MQQNILTIDYAELFQLQIEDKNREKLVQPLEKKAILCIVYSNHVHPNMTNETTHTINVEIFIPDRGV